MSSCSLDKDVSRRRMSSPAAVLMIVSEMSANAFSIRSAVGWSVIFVLCSGCKCHLTHKSATSAKICVKRPNLAKICVKLSLKKRQKVVEYAEKCPLLLAEKPVYIK